MGLRQERRGTRGWATTTPERADGSPAAPSKVCEREALPSAPAGLPERGPKAAEGRQPGGLLPRVHRQVGGLSQCACDWGTPSEAQMKLVEILRDQGSTEGGHWVGHPHRHQPHPSPGQISVKASEVLGFWMSTRSMPVSNYTSAARAFSGKPFPSAGAGRTEHPPLRGQSVHLGSEASLRPSKAPPL